MWSKEFWKDAAERCIATMAEVAIPLIPISGNIEGMNFGHIAIAILGSGLVCLLKCIVKAIKKGSGDGNQESSDSIQS